jgi:hypothetical protein
VLVKPQSSLTGKAQHFSKCPSLGSLANGHCAFRMIFTAKTN